MIPARIGIGATADPLEQLADRTADRLMAGARPAADPHGAALPASAATSGVDTPGIVHDVLASAGRPLDGAERAFFEPRFGVDLSAVRLHADAQASASAQAVRASAYAVGAHVAFAPGAYAAGTAAGRRLLAHELAHVVQQDGSSAAWMQRQPATAPPPLPAPRVVFVDNDVIGEIADGNPRGAMLLLGLLHSHADVRIWRGTYNELQRGEPRQAGARLLIVQQLGITIDEGVNLAGRAATYEHIGGRGQPNPQLKDAPMIAAVAALRAQGGATANAEIMSLDGGVRENAPRLGVPIAPESAHFGPRVAHANVRAGLDNLGLTDWDVAADGAPRRNTASGTVAARQPGASPNSDEQRGSVRGPGSYAGVPSGEIVSGETTAPPKGGPTPGGDAQRGSVRGPDSYRGVTSGELVSGEIETAAGGAAARPGTGALVAVGIAEFGLQIIGSLITNKYITQPSFERQMAFIGPTIMQRIKAQEEFGLTMLVMNPDTPIYAQITVESDTDITYSEGANMQPHADFSVLPKLSLQNVLVAVYPAQGVNYEVEGHPYISTTKRYYTYSVRLDRPPFETLIAFAARRGLSTALLRRYAQAQLGTAQQWAQAAQDDPDDFEIVRDFGFGPEQPAADAVYWKRMIALLDRSSSH